MPGKVLRRKYIGGLGAKINRALMLNHYRSPFPWHRGDLVKHKKQASGELEDDATLK